MIWVFIKNLSRNLVSYHGLGRKLVLLRIKYGPREKSWKISQ